MTKQEVVEKLQHQKNLGNFIEVGKLKAELKIRFGMSKSDIDNLPNPLNIFDDLFRGVNI